MNPSRWLVTGVAGFIGSNLLEELLQLGQYVVGIDNLSTGDISRLEVIRNIVGDQKYSRFSFHEGDVSTQSLALQLTDGVDFVLHQAALGSVPRSVEHPAPTHEANVNGTFNLLLAARERRVKSFVYASSSSVYGNSQELPKREDLIGDPLSPYAVSKRVGELYAGVFSSLYGVTTIGLRYFNVFGPRQDPSGVYAAVIPRWLGNMVNGQQCVVFGDGSASRDFCYVSNVVEANIRAALIGIENKGLTSILNIGAGRTTSLNTLYDLIRSKVIELYGINPPEKPSYQAARKGEILHSLADISRAQKLMSFNAAVTVEQGIDKTVRYFYKN